MVIIYRLKGFSGDATEDIIKKKEEIIEIVDKEVKYQSAYVLESNGI